MLSVGSCPLQRGWGLGDPNGYKRLWPCPAGPSASCALASPAYPSSFLPFLFSFGEARGDALTFQSFTGSLCADALAPNPPDVEAKLATSSSWSLWRNSRGEDITHTTGLWHCGDGFTHLFIHTWPESATHSPTLTFHSHLCRAQNRLLCFHPGLLRLSSSAVQPGLEGPKAAWLNDACLAANTGTWTPGWPSRESKHSTSLQLHRQQALDTECFARTEEDQVNLKHLCDPQYLVDFHLLTSFQHRLHISVWIYLWIVDNPQLSNSAELVRHTERAHRTSGGLIREEGCQKQETYSWATLAIWYKAQYLETDLLIDFYW